MRKLFLTMFLLTLLVGIAVAQDDVTVASQPADDCYSRCKAGPYAACVQQGGAEDACYKEAYEPCAAQCPQVTPLPPPTVAVRPASSCEMRCKVSLDSCLKTGAADCRQKYGVCMKQCQPVPPVSCEEKCKQRATTAATTAAVAAVGGFNQQVYEQCVKDECKRPDCFAQCKLDVDACIKAGGDKASCMAKYDICASACKAEPTTCVDKCYSEFSPERCRLGASAEECKRRLTACVEGCKPPMPPKPTCELKCQDSYKECSAAGKEGCEEKLKACYGGCKPEPYCPPGVGCEMSCAARYQGCTKRARETKDDKALAACREEVGICLDGCTKPTPLPPVTCEEGCAKVKATCLAAGLDEATCAMKVNACLKACVPTPPPTPSCEGGCAKMKAECLAAGVDEATCAEKVETCLKGCEPILGRAAGIPEPGPEPTPEPGFLRRLWTRLFR